MTRISLALLSIVLSANCSGGTSSGSGQWQKAGASEQTMTQDSTQCRQAAQAKALGQYPYRGGEILTQQRDDTNRTIVEDAQFNDCMQGKGYRRAS